MNQRLLPFLAIASLLSISETAFAQAAPPAEGAPPPPAAGEPATAPAAAPPPAAPPPAAAPPPVQKPAAAPEEEEEKARFRWGISALGGPLLMGGNTGGVGGVDVRLGAQISNMIGIYGQPVALIGGGASASTTGSSASALVMGGVGALVDFTFADLFYVAVGPEFMSGATGSSRVGVTGTGSSAESGTFFSVAARAGFALGSMKPTRRKAFTIGLDFRTIFTEDPVVAPLVALGYDAF